MRTAGLCILFRDSFFLPWGRALFALGRGWQRMKAPKFSQSASKISVTLNAGTRSLEHREILKRALTRPESNADEVPRYSLTLFASTFFRMLQQS